VSIRTRGGAVAAVTLCAVLGLWQLPVGASGSPPPATAAQVSALVAASAKIKKEDATVLAELPTAPTDQPWTQYGTVGENGCDATTVCVYGDTTASKTVVLFGDSHASMWLSAVAPWATAHHERLVLVWDPGCPPAILPTNWQWLDPPGVTSNPSCLTWRTAALAYVVSLHPSLVLIAERTAAIKSEPSGKAFSTSQWQSALEKTIRKLESSQTKVAVIEDVPWHDESVPECLSREPSDVQACSVPYPNKLWPGQQKAERSAAETAHASLIDTVGWFCIKSDTTCSSVIGNYITYWDNGHVTASYAAYLSGVMGSAITKAAG
jgi:hypothetical protein